MRIALGMLVATLVLSAGCASGLHRPVSSTDAVTDGNGVQRVNVDMHTFYFKPNRIVVHAGRPVEMVLRNRALVVPHNFSVQDPSIAVSVNKWGPGTAIVRFTPKTPGEYAFHCDEHGHEAKGMTGTLVVVP
jgi:plastocyanin